MPKVNELGLQFARLDLENNLLIKANTISNINYTFGTGNERKQTCSRKGQAQYSELTEDPALEQGTRIIRKLRFWTCFIPGSGVGSYQLDHSDS